MPSGQVPLWVPLVVALLGVLGVLTSQVIATRREDKRWSREQEQEELRWRRDRQREIEERTYRGRLDAYSRMISTLEEWGWALHPTKRWLLDRVQPLNDAQRAELIKLRDLAPQALGPMNLFAPSEVRALMKTAVLAWADFTTVLIESEESEDELRARWQHCWDSSRAVRAAIRRHLGTDDLDFADTLCNDSPATCEVPDEGARPHETSGDWRD